MGEQEVKGIIVKELKDLYYVDTSQGLVESNARGVFREKNIKPIVGDRVRIRLSQGGKGYIEEVYKRDNQLIRPGVANVDYVVNVHSIKEPNINTYTLDKALIMAEYHGIESIIIFSKFDLVRNEEYTYYYQIYQGLVEAVFKASTEIEDDLPAIEDKLAGKVSAVSGPSGSGKSSLIKRMNEDLDLETSSVSVKTKRGRHTTRHVELLEIADETYILDTPGFSSINLNFIEDEDLLDKYMPELKKLKPACKFNNCMHINEPGCQVKKELGQSVSQSRYDNYLLFVEEVKEARRY